MRIGRIFTGVLVVVSSVGRGDRLADGFVAGSMGGAVSGCGVGDSCEGDVLGGENGAGVLVRETRVEVGVLDTAVLGVAEIPNWKGVQQIPPNETVFWHSS